MCKLRISHYIDDIDFELFTIFPPETCKRNSAACFDGNEKDDCFIGSGDFSCDIKDQVSNYINEGTINQWEAKNVYCMHNFITYELLYYVLYVIIHPVGSSGSLNLKVILQPVESHQVGNKCHFIRWKVL